jgi:hypothetical protein
MAAAGCVAAAAISGQTAGLLVSASMLALAWVAPIIEANRLEAVIQGASEDVTRELNEAKDPCESTDATSPVLDSLDWERPEATSG